MVWILGEEEDPRDTWGSTYAHSNAEWYGSFID